MSEAFEVVEDQPIDESHRATTQSHDDGSE